MDVLRRISRKNCRAVESKESDQNNVGRFFYIYKQAEKRRLCIKKERERAFEYGLPEYLQHDLDAYKEGLKVKSDLLDCLWGELYGSINIAEINDGAITREHAEFLRKKYLFGGKHDRND